MLDGLLEGLPYKRGDKVLVIDCTPCLSAELAAAILEKQLARDAVDVPLMAYLGLPTCKLDAQYLQKQIFGLLMSSWWESQPEAGPRQRPAADSGSAGPAMKICNVQDGVLRVLPALHNRFDGLEQEGQWRQLLDKHCEKYGAPAVAGTCGSVAVETEGGPVWNYPGLSQRMLLGGPVVLAQLQPPSDVDGRVWKVPPKRSSLGVTVMSCGRLGIVALADDSPAPQELCGFNTGNFNRAAAVVPPGAVAWQLDGDHVPVVWVMKAWG